MMIYHQIVDTLMELEEGTKIQVLAPVVRGRKGEFVKLLEGFSKEGFVRARVDGEVVELTDDLEIDRKKKHNVEIIVNRLVVKEDLVQITFYRDELTNYIKENFGLTFFHFSLVLS